MAETNTPNIIEGSSNELSSNSSKGLELVNNNNTTDSKFQLPVSSMQSSENVTNHVNVVSSSLINPQKIINDEHLSTYNNNNNPNMLDLESSRPISKNNSSIDNNIDIISHNINSNAIPNTVETTVMNNSQSMDLPKSSTNSPLTINLNGISDKPNNTIINFPQTHMNRSHDQTSSNFNGNSPVSASNTTMTMHNSNSPNLFQINTTDKTESNPNKSMVELNKEPNSNGVNKLRLPISASHINIQDKIRKHSQPHNNPSQASFTSSMESSSSHLRMFQRMDEMAARMITMEEQFLKLTKAFNVQNRTLQRLETVINKLSYDLEQNRVTEQKRHEHQKDNCVEISRERQFIIDLLNSITSVSSSYLAQNNQEKGADNDIDIRFNNNDKNNSDDLISARITNLSTNIGSNIQNVGTTHSKFISNNSNNNGKNSTASLNMSNSVPELHTLQSSYFVPFKKNIRGNNNFVLNPNGIKKRKRFHTNNRAQQLSLVTNGFLPLNNDSHDKTLSNTNRIINNSNIVTTSSNDIPKMSISTNTKSLPATTITNVDSNIQPSSTLDPLNINHFMFSSSEPIDSTSISTTHPFSSSNTNATTIRNNNQVNMVTNNENINQGSTKTPPANNNNNNTNDDNSSLYRMGMKYSLKHANQGTHSGNKASNVGILEDEDGYQEDDDEEEEEKEYNDDHHSISGQKKIDSVVHVEDDEEEEYEEEEEEEEHCVKQTNESCDESIEDEEENNEDSVNGSNNMAHIRRNDDNKKITTKDLKKSRNKSVKKVKTKIGKNPKKITGESSTPEVNNDLNYKILKAPNTVRTIWEEYVHGINGNPSIRGLEEKYGNKWRLTKNRKTFSRRKRLYKYILNGIDNGKTADEMIKILEERRLYRDENGEVKRRTIGWLQQSLIGI